MIFLSSVLPTIAILLAIPVAIFLVEVVASVALPPRDFATRVNVGSRPRIAFLVPAHNESTGLLPTIADIKAQMHGSDRLLVVADNCTDDTGAVAAAAGADVIDRHDPDRRGKGYALAMGVRHLGADPPDVVIVIDADCRLVDSSIDRLAIACAKNNRPVQALYLMTAPNESAINYRVSEFAWRIKNLVRPLGLSSLGLPCQLMGTGMAFPWAVIRSVDLASGSIVEDMKLGLDLALVGSPPLFCHYPTVTSTFPSSIQGAQGQRLRWEQGHIGMIVTAAPRLIVSAVLNANPKLLALTLDLLVPPLSLLGTLVAGITLVAALAMLLGTSSVALAFSILTLAGLIGGVVVCWFKCGRDILPSGAIPLIIGYVLGKLPIYRRFVSLKSRPRWERTDRRKF